jgi:hypothetical protein
MNNSRGKRVGGSGVLSIITGIFSLVALICYFVFAHNVQETSALTLIMLILTVAFCFFSGFSRLFIATYCASAFADLAFGAFLLNAVPVFAAVASKVSNTSTEQMGLVAAILVFTMITVLALVVNCFIVKKEPAKA